MNEQIKPNLAVESAVAQFHPRFGNVHDIEIMHLYEELLDTLKRNASVLKQKKELETMIGTFRKRAQRIKELEDAIIWGVKRAQHELSPKS